MFVPILVQGQTGVFFFCLILPPISSHVYYYCHHHHYHSEICEVLTVALLKIQIFWDVTLRRWKRGPDVSKDRSVWGWRQSLLPWSQGTVTEAARRFSQRYDMGRVLAVGWRHQMATGQCVDASVFLFIFILTDPYRQGWFGAQWRKPSFCSLWTTSIKECPLRVRMSSSSLLWRSVLVHSRREIKHTRLLHSTHISLLAPELLFF